MENMETSTDEFFEAFDGADGYKTDTEKTTEENPTTEAENTADEPQEPPQSEETADEAATKNAEEAPSESTPEADSEESGPSQQFISVKYDKETRQVSMEDAPGWIQKGMNYDRVKEQLDTTRQNAEALQEKLSQQGEVMETLELISQTVNVPIPELLEQLHVNAVKGTGKTEAEAKAIIRADKLERQLKNKEAAKTGEGSQEDAKAKKVAAELADFRKQYPNVDLNDSALVEQLRPYVQSGMSLTSAYLKAENQRLQAEIQQQKQEEAAAAKNRENRTKSPGSQRDTGGQRMKTAEDDFFAAFEK